MWSLDVDNIPHPHLSFESSDSDQSSNVHPPSGSSGSSAVVVGDLSRRHEHYYFADDNIIFQVCKLIYVLCSMSYRLTN
jgi:hypothetical protein